MRAAVVLAIPTLAAALPYNPLKALFKREDSWGGAVSLGPTTSTIKHAVTTILPGTPPSSQAGELFLWPGMSNGTGDLVQTTLEQWSSGNSWCGASSDQWCVRASLFGSFGQKDGNASAVSGDQKVKIEYVLEDDNDTWTQLVTDADTGDQLSTFSYKSGPYMTGYGTGTECDDSCTPTVSDQYYYDTTLTLAEADTAFGDTIATSGTATYKGLSSSQGGKVWTIEQIYIPAGKASKRGLF
ncbi:hypothetical protein HDK77DRAFT_69611 [Phyllosticta capitalensis]|uniref:Uncharacterized protein n=1 Tax=Phyllosticta capitalensis TaxID=121624 RepID=A0ABR1YQC4_9PEZI